MDIRVTNIRARSFFVDTSGCTDIRNHPDIQVDIQTDIQMDIHAFIPKDSLARVLLSFFF